MVESKRVRRTALMRRSGPYKVESYADGTLIVTPAWPAFPKAGTRGGGPGLFSRLGLAADIERFLNG